MLALQMVGGAAGNMICINSFIATRAMIGGELLPVSEGAFIRPTLPALAIMIVVASLAALPFLLA
jgi:L-lactate permease